LQQYEKLLQVCSHALWSMRTNTIHIYYVCVCVCVCVCIYMYIHTHTYIYMYTRQVYEGLWIVVMLVHIYYLLAATCCEQQVTMYGFVCWEFLTYCYYWLLPNTICWFMRKLLDRSHSNFGILLLMVQCIPSLFQISEVK
jgi:hypothetical protein